MTNLHQRLAKLEALTEARGATPAEAARARELAAKLRARLEADPQPTFTSTSPDGRYAFVFESVRNTNLEDIERWTQAFRQSGRRIVSPAWDPNLNNLFKARPH